MNDGADVTPLLVHQVSFAVNAAGPLAILFDLLYILRLVRYDVSIVLAGPNDATNVHIKN